MVCPHLRRRSRFGGKSNIFSCGLLHRLFEATPPTMVAGDESVGFRRTAGSSRIIRERWRRQLAPRFFDRRDDVPLGFHFISAREECMRRLAESITGTNFSFEVLACNSSPSCSVPGSTSTRSRQSFLRERLARTGECPAVVRSSSQSDRHETRRRPAQCSPTAGRNMLSRPKTTP
jgi:hypothetical protein